MYIYIHIIQKLMWMLLLMAARMPWKCPKRQEIPGNVRKILGDHLRGAGAVASHTRSCWLTCLLCPEIWFSDVFSHISFDFLRSHASILGFPSRANMSNYLSGLAFHPGVLVQRKGGMTTLGALSSLWWYVDEIAKGRLFQVDRGRIGSSLASHFCFEQPRGAR